ncbi:MAG TPA: radical SAM protein [Polyangiaceae bacterium]
MADARRVALLCIDPWLKKEGSYRPFNYSVRRIEAAIRAEPEFDSLDLRVFDTQSADPDALFAELERFDPDVIGASAYVWSFPTFLEVSRRARARRPDVTSIFGGPSARPEMFALAPFAPYADDVDALVLGEGERTIQDILRLPDRSRDSLSTLPGLSISNGSSFVATAHAEPPPLEGLASPFQMDLVPHGFTGHLETFRGCPLSCSFCQWGDLSNASRTFSKEYLVRELEAFGRMEARGVTLVDAALNLNPRAFRNLVQAEEDVRFLRSVHFHTEVYPSHMTPEHLRFLETIEADSVGIGLQSYDPEVLKRVERNFYADRFERTVRDVGSIVPDTVVEIILGLPGDNPDSFRRTLEQARRLPVGVRVYKCLVLPNALMSRAPAHFAMEYDPRTLQMISCWGWSREELERACEELTELVKTDGGEILDGSDTWKFPSFAEAERRRVRHPAALSLRPDLQALLARELGAASDLTWALREARYGGERLVLSTETPEGALDIEIRSAQNGRPGFRTRAGIAFSYVPPPNRTPGRATLAVLERVADRLGPILRKSEGLPFSEPHRLPLVR